MQFKKDMNNLVNLLNELIDKISLYNQERLLSNDKQLSLLKTASSIENQDVTCQNIESSLKREYKKLVLLLIDRICDEVRVLNIEIDEIQNNFLHPQINSKEPPYNIIEPLLNEFLDGYIEYDNVEQLEEMSKLCCQIKISRIRRNIISCIKQLTNKVPNNGEFDSLNRVLINLIENKNGIL